MSADYSAVVDEVKKSGATIGDIQKVLKGLLREGVSIRDHVTIMETIADYFASVKDPDELIELVRQALSSQICQRFLDQEKKFLSLQIQKRLKKKFEIPFYNIVKSVIPNAVVLSSFEIVTDIRLKAVGNIAF